METPKYNGRLKAGMTSYNAKGQRAWQGETCRSSLIAMKSTGNNIRKPKLFIHIKLHIPIINDSLATEAHLILDKTPVVRIASI